MTRVRDRRQANWFWMNKDVLDEYGPTIGANGIAVYAFLARCANEQGHAFPSVRYIAKHVALSTNTVMKYLDVLAKVGLVECKLRRDEAGDMATTEYVLLTPQECDIQKGVSASETGVSTVETHQQPEVSQPVRQVSQLLGDGVSTTETFQEVPNKLNPKPEDTPPISPHGGMGSRRKSSKQPATDYTEGFQLVWTVYPRKEVKVEAFAIWCERNLEARAVEIAAKVERLTITLWAGRERTKIPLPTTYLNQARYEDDLVSLEVAHEQEARERLSDREYRSVLAGQRWMENSNAGNGPVPLCNDDAEALDGIQYRIDRA